MKKLTNPYKFLFTTVLLLATSAWAIANNGDDLVEKKKTYTKSYNVSGNDRVSVNNKFGEVKIVLWDKNEVKADVSITIKANTEEEAQRIIDGISIEDGKDNEGVYFKTKMPEHTNLNSTNNKNKDDKNKDKDKKDKSSQNLEIDYVVYMPGGNPLNLTNQFGKTIVPDMKGAVSITQKFGDLVAGNLSNVKELSVEFSTAVIESLANCKFEIKFSKAEIKKMSGSIKSSFEFSDGIKIPLDNSITELNLFNSYSNVQVKVSDNFNGDFDIHTNFGEFINKTSLPIKEQKGDEEGHGPKFDKNFSGKTGNGSSKVKIKTNFGNVVFN